MERSARVASELAMNLFMISGGPIYGEVEPSVKRASIKFRGRRSSI